jgi:membrane dipeptidase
MANAGVYSAMTMKNLWSGVRILPALVALACDASLVAPHLAAQTPAPAAPAAAAAAPAADDALVKKAKAIHERVITLDTHDDIEPSNFTAEKNYTQALTNQVNLPKMFAGGLDAVFFVVYVGQGELTPAGYDQAYKSAIEKFEAIHRLTEQIAPDKIGLALTSADVRRIAASGRKVALIGVENGYPIGEDLSRVKEFYDRGARYLSLAHNGHSQLADSNTGERDGKWLHNGLSPLGKQVIAEANKWGVMVDISHPSKASNLQAMALSKAPVIASHSGVRALCDHSRNLDDEQLLALKKNGGVAQIVAFSTYVKTPKPDTPERAAALSALRKEFGLPEQPAGGPGGGGPGGAGPGGGAGGGGRGGLARLPEGQREAFQKRMAALNQQYPADRATVQDFVNHIDYAVKKIGIDHVGISSDFDGGGGVIGWNDASETFNVTLELVKRGYTEPQIAQLWSGNLLRVMDEVQKVAKDLQRAGSH